MFSYRRMDALVNKDKLTTCDVLPKNKKLEIELGGRLFIVKYQVSAKLSRFLSALKEESAYDPAKAVADINAAAEELEEENEQWDYDGDTDYKYKFIDRSTESLKKREKTFRKDFFCKVCEWSADDEFLKKILYEAPKKKNGELMKNRVTRVAALFFVNFDMEYVELVGLPKSETELLVTVRKSHMSSDSLEKIEKDMLSSGAFPQAVCTPEMKKAESGKAAAEKPTYDGSTTKIWMFGTPAILRLEPEGNYVPFDMDISFLDFDCVTEKDGELYIDEKYMDDIICPLTSTALIHMDLSRFRQKLEHLWKSMLETNGGFDLDDWSSKRNKWHKKNEKKLEQGEITESFSAVGGRQYSMEESVGRFIWHLSQLKLFCSLVVKHMPRKENGMLKTNSSMSSYDFAPGGWGSRPKHPEENVDFHKWPMGIDPYYHLVGFSAKCTAEDEICIR